MMQLLKDGSYRGVEIIHVRMNFSREMGEVRKLSIRKVIHFGELVVRIILARLKQNATALYYPPSGPSLLPMMRDVAILAPTRWMFAVTIFHFQAGGLSEAYARIPWLLKPLVRLAYFRPDAAIELSDSSPRDGAALQARQVIIVPNACPDEARLATSDELAVTTRIERMPTNILFVGVLRESKGVLDLLRACRILYELGMDFRLKLMGSWESMAFHARVLQMAHDFGIGDLVQILGVKTDVDKAREFRLARVLCLPSYFDSESFPVCIVEAMMHGVPVVATYWRGIPSLVRDGDTGFLVSVGDVEALADRLRQLLNNSLLAGQMGKAARRAYERNYTATTFHTRIQDVFDRVVRVS